MHFGLMPDSRKISDGLSLLFKSAHINSNPIQFLSANISSWLVSCPFCVCWKKNNPGLVHSPGSVNKLTRKVSRTAIPANPQYSSQSATGGLFQPITGLEEGQGWDGGVVVIVFLSWQCASMDLRAGLRKDAEIRYVLFGCWVPISAIFLQNWWLYI